MKTVTRYDTRLLNCGTGLCRSWTICVWRERREIKFGRWQRGRRCSASPPTPWSMSVHTWFLDLQKQKTYYSPLAAITLSSIKHEKMTAFFFVMKFFPRFLLQSWHIRFTMLLLLYGVFLVIFSHVKVLGVHSCVTKTLLFKVTY